MKSNHKPPMCTNYYKCSVPKIQRLLRHVRIYHDPKPVEIPNPLSTGGPFIKIHRDPQRGMYFPCPHPACDHTSILRSGPVQHQKTCRFTRQDLQSLSATDSGASVAATAADVALLRPVEMIQKLGHGHETLSSHRKVDRFSLRSTLLAVSTAQSSGSDSDYAPPGLNNNKNYNDQHNSHTSSVNALSQILRSMDHISDTVTGLSKRLKMQRMSIDRMREQMEWLADQVDEIRTQSASLDAHTESLRIDAGLVEDHLGELLQDNRKVKEHMRGIREDVGRVGPRFQESRYQQHQGPVYRSSRY